MEMTMSLIRFLMFITFAIVIIFNLLPRKLSETEEVEPSEVSDKSTTKDNNKDDIYNSSDTGYGISSNNINISNSDTEQDSAITNIQWKKALEYDKISNDMYNYTNDDIDKLTLMSSQDMISCLKNDNSCEEMEFGECKQLHVASYMDDNTCLSAKSAMSTVEYCLDDGSCNVIQRSDGCNSNNRFSTKEKCEEGNIKYCNVDNKCVKKHHDVTCSNENLYQSMNNCASTEDVEQDEGEYCLYENACNKQDIGQTCEGRYYMSLETCKMNNIEYCLDENDNTCNEIQKNESCKNDKRFFDSKCENTTEDIKN